jgi:hypothetical protein
MFLDDSACNLASINLMKFVGEDGELDAKAFEAACRTMITAQEILVDNSSYPTPAIAKNSHDYRPLGLGYANIGALLMSRGLPYDGDSGRAYAAAITALMHGAAFAQSAKIARDHGGPFAGYEKNKEPFLRVMRKHRAALRDIDRTWVPKDLFAAARDAWDEVLELGEQHGFRNAQATVLAPTGTIGFMMDCDTTGVEPDIALVKYKKLVGGGLMKIVNQTVPMALQKLGYSALQIKEIVEYIDEHETIEGAPHVKDTHLPVFDCAFKPARGVRSIHYMGHVRMMGAVQPFSRAPSARRSTSRRRRPSRRSSRPTSTRGGWARRPCRSTATAASARSRSTRRRTRRRSSPRPWRRASRSSSAASCPTSARRSRTSSTSRATRATSPSGSTKTACPASSSSSWRRRARRSAASPMRSRRRSATRSSTACRCRTWWTSSATSASSRRG